VGRAKQMRRAARAPIPEPEREVRTERSWCEGCEDADRILRDHDRTCHEPVTPAGFRPRGEVWFDEESFLYLQRYESIAPVPGIAVMRCTNGRRIRKG